MLWTGVYTDDSAFPNTEKYGEVPESAMVITDKQGDIVAIAGGRGQKDQQPFVLLRDRCTPPAGFLDQAAGKLRSCDGCRYATPDTTVYDRAFIQDADGNPWPMNDGKYPTGRCMTVKEGVDALAQYRLGTAAQRS